MIEIKTILKLNHPVTTTVWTQQTKISSHHLIINNIINYYNKVRDLFFSALSNGGLVRRDLTDAMQCCQLHNNSHLVPIENEWKTI